MYQLRPPYVLMLDEVRDDPVMAARAQRMLDAIDEPPQVEVIALDELPAAAERLGWHRVGGRMGMPPPETDGGWFFGVMRWDGRWNERWTAIREAWPKAPGLLRVAYGYDSFQMFRSGLSDIRICPDHVCRPAWRIHLVRGCPHKCFYCGLHEPLTFMLNVEQYVRKLDELADLNPWQTTWLYEDDSEALAQEPEYGGLPAVMDWAARREDPNYIIIHTKSANVDWMREQAHNGRTILVWSLTGFTQSKLMEPGTATTEDRIEAARKCHEWGYTTRYKYKPIVPVKGWRDEIAEMTRLVFTRSRPDVISLFTLAWMDYADLVRLADTELLDPEFLAGAEQAAAELGQVKVRPFPHELRRKVYEHCIQEIRKHDRQIPISLCTESIEMWKDLGSTLGLNPSNYPCGCGPQAEPNLERLPVVPWKVAQPVEVSLEPSG